MLRLEVGNEVSTCRQRNAASAGPERARPFLAILMAARFKDKCGVDFFSSLRDRRSMVKKHDFT